MYALSPPERRPQPFRPGRLDGHRHVTQAHRCRSRAPNLGSQVQLESSGNAKPIFMGVSTINVDIRNGANDFVALDNAVAKGS